MILHRTSGGSLERLRALAQDRSASVYCRSSAIRAMTYAVADGTAARSEVLEFIDTLLHSEAGDPDFMSMLISDANRLYPLELRETIQRAFAERSRGHLLHRVPGHRSHAAGYTRGGAGAGAP